MVESTVDNDPFRLRSIGSDKQSLTASPGTFRPILTIDSEAYRVGHDRKIRMEALKALTAVYRTSCACQIYDDQGQPQLDENGRLI